MKGIHKKQNPVACWRRGLKLFSLEAGDGETPTYVPM